MHPKPLRISLIAALGERTRAIGKNNDLIWKDLKPDMRRFKEKTSGHPVIMGRHTWLSIPERYRPLPDRTNIVITSAERFEPAGAHRASSLEEAIEMARTFPGSDEIFIIGGGRVYADALPLADRLYLTLVESSEEGDTFFPEYAAAFTKAVEEETHAEHVPPFTFLTLER